MIPVFNGEDYSMWKKRITMYLKFKKCDEVIKRGKVTTDNEWDEKELKAVNHIVTVQCTHIRREGYLMRAGARLLLRI